eukprot:c23500_g1_i2 orf=2-151(-)
MPQKRALSLAEQALKYQTHPDVLALSLPLPPCNGADTSGNPGPRNHVRPR